MNATRAQLHINIYMFIASKFLNKLRKRVLSFCLNTIFPPFVFFTLFRTCVRAYVRFFFFLSVSPFLGAVRSLYLLIPAFNVFFIILGHQQDRAQVLHQRYQQNWRCPRENVELLVCGSSGIVDRLRGIILCRLPAGSGLWARHVLWNV